LTLSQLGFLAGCDKSYTLKNKLSTKTLKPCRIFVAVSFYLKNYQ